MVTKMERLKARKAEKNEFVIMGLGAILVVALATGLGEQAGTIIAPLMCGIGMLMTRISKVSS